MILSTPILDPAVAYPSLATLRASLAARDWKACRAQLDATAPSERTFLIAKAAAADEDKPAEPGPYRPEDVELFLRQVVQDDPADGAAAAMLGEHLITRAWAVRTARSASAVSSERFHTFHELLRIAEQVLTPAAAAAPDDPAVWTARLTTARGLSMGQPEAMRRYDHIARIDPHHLPGQIQLAQQLAPKWGGSWEVLHGFCKHVGDTAAPGSPNPMLVAEGHFERWFDLRGIRINEANAYLRSAPVRAEIEEAAHKSVWHPAFTHEQYGWVAATSMFAAAYSLLGDLRSAKTLQRRLGRLSSEYPWAYVFPTASVAIRWHRLKTIVVRAR